MGYRSDLLIAITKKAYSVASRSTTIPVLLQEFECLSDSGVLYWKIESIKFYPEYDQVKELQAFFKRLNYLNAEGETSINGGPSFGALRLGDDGTDSESWGQPNDFELYIQRELVAPVEF